MAVLFLLAALLQEPVSSTLYGPRFLAGELGGSVTHQCFYSSTPANKHDRKYWCKIARSGVCYTIVSTTGYTSKDHARRVSLRDIPQNGTFAVTMTELKSSDAGTYRCGIGTTNRDLYVSLDLRVLADAGAVGPTELIRGELHGSVTVLCPPGDTRGGEKRFWCKLGRTSCALIADTNGYVGKSYEGRIFITTQESSGAFKVSINDLKKEDSGLYRCGMGRRSDQASPRVVDLQVTTASTLPKRPKFLSGTVGGSLSLKCRYDPKGNYEKKYLCRWKEASCSPLVDTGGFVHESYEGRIQIASSDPENGTYTVVMSHLREEDAGWYWCGAKKGHAEHTSPVKLRVQKETFSSQDPETSTLVKPTLSPSPAAYSTPTQRSTTGLTHVMGTSTESTVSTVTESTVTESVSTISTVTESTSTESVSTISTVTESTVTESVRTISTVTESTSTESTISTVTESTSTESTSTISTVTKSSITSTESVSTISTGTESTSTISTVTESSITESISTSTETPSTETPSTLLPTAPTSTSVTSPGEIYHESSSRESRLLPVVLPALILLIFILIAILALTKIRLHKETGEERSTVGSLEATPIRSDLNPVKEQTMEETLSPEKVPKCRTDSGKPSNPTGKKILFKVTDEESRQKPLPSQPPCS